MVDISELSFSFQFAAAAASLPLLPSSPPPLLLRRCFSLVSRSLPNSQYTCSVPISAQSGRASAKKEYIPMEKPGNFRCVECGFPIKTLYIQYSLGNVRLNKCENCKRVADEYIECELMIIVIDLILHKPKAYRHLFYNLSSRNTVVDFEGFLWGSIFGFLVLDAYGLWVLSSSGVEWSSLISFASLLWGYAKILIGTVLGNILFISVILIGCTKFLNSSALGLRWKHIVLAILVSSYFKIFLVSTMVWEFPSSVIFLIDVFVLSSNTVALKVLGTSTTIGCLGFCFAAHAVKFLVTRGLKILY